jgi:hypothetical protein
MIGYWIKLGNFCSCFIDRDQSLSIIPYWQGLSLSIVPYWQGLSLSIIPYWQGPYVFLASVGSWPDATIEKEREAPRGGWGQRPDWRPAPLRLGCTWARGYHCACATYLSWFMLSLCIIYLKSYHHVQKFCLCCQLSRAAQWKSIR